ncbi:major capsid protein [Microbacterium sp. CFBP9023]|uniref:major capsid protein n=1 Tax=Microbacterium sp. CFBP9023 TaxID=3096535 RepID=UPI0025CE1084|nr:major capsid protein [Microbacterium sp. CFBP9023]MDY0984585.1 major capsid protein [Microbacterium sp. CFBP9023]
MGFSKNHRTPAQLTAFARAAFRLHVESFATAAMLPLEASPTLTYSVNIGQSVLPAAASYRSWNTESEVGTLEGGQTADGKLPPISIRTPVDEHQQLVLMNMDDAIAEAFEKRARRNAQAVGSRFVLGQVEALVTGKVTIAERNLSVVVDFGRKAAQTGVAPTLWNAAGADPLSDLDGMRAVMGKGISSVVMPRAILALMQTNEEIIKLVAKRGTDLPTRVSEDDVRSVLREWGYGEIRINEQTIVNRAGVEQPLFPTDRITLLSGSEFGSTLLGITAESLAQDNGISRGEAAGLFSGATHTHDPEGYNVLVSAIGLPVLQAPDNTASLKVA